VDCGDDTTVQRGDEVVLIGSQGNERITADEWATRLDTIGYEVVCAIGPRVQRRYHGKTSDRRACPPSSMEEA
jgi:alanine racemase